MSRWGRGQRFRVSWTAASAALALAVVHLFAGRLAFLDAVPRSRWLSVAGGISVAYVFVHLLPELGEAQETLAESVGFLERHAYLFALVGLMTFHGLERVSRRSRRARGGHGEAATSPGVAWLAIGSYAAYNALIGALLVSGDRVGVNVLLFALAVGVHFVVNDRGLHVHHGQVYRRRGRWLLSAAVLVGFVGSSVVPVPQAALAILLAFLAGGIVLNVLKEELPEDRDSRFLPFLVGGVAYTALLLLL